MAKQTEPPPARQWFTLEQAAEYLNLAPADVHALAAAGELRPAIDLTGKLSPVASDVHVIDGRIYPHALPEDCQADLLYPAPLEAPPGLLYVNLAGAAPFEPEEAHAIDWQHGPVPPQPSDSERARWAQIDRQRDEAPADEHTADYAEIRPARARTGATAAPAGAEGAAQPPIGPVALETAEGAPCVLSRAAGGPVARLLRLSAGHPLVFDRAELARYATGQAENATGGSTGRDPEPRETTLALMGAALRLYVEALEPAQREKLMYRGELAPGALAAALVGTADGSTEGVLPFVAGTGQHQRGLGHENARKLVAEALKQAERRVDYPE